MVRGLERFQRHWADYQAHDVFRLYQLLAAGQKVNITATIKQDMVRFIESMRGEQGLNLKDFGLKSQSLDEVLQNLALIYGLEDPR